jgi:hypothetical protein
VPKTIRLTVAAEEVVFEGEPNEHIGERFAMHEIGRIRDAPEDENEVREVLTDLIREIAAWGQALLAECEVRITS